MAPPNLIRRRSALCVTHFWDYLRLAMYQDLLLKASLHDPEKDANISTSTFLSENASALVALPPGCHLTSPIKQEEFVRGPRWDHLKPTTWSDEERDAHQRKLDDMKDLHNRIYLDKYENLSFSGWAEMLMDAKWWVEREVVFRSCACPKDPDDCPADCTWCQVDDKVKSMAGKLVGKRLRMEVAEKEWALRGVKREQDHGSEEEWVPLEASEEKQFRFGDLRFAMDCCCYEPLIVVL